MQTLPESTSCHLARNLVTAVALVGFGVLSMTTLGQRRTVDRLATRVAVLEQQNLRLTTSLQALEASARDEQDELSDGPPSDEEMEGLVTAAQELYVHGEYETAAQIVEPATRVETTASRAWRIIGATSCFQHDAQSAKRARAKLDASGQQFVTYVCEKNGIKL